MTDEFQTLAAEFRYEADRVKGSRFLATAAPVGDAAAAEAVVGRVRSEFPDASHHCWAWRLGRSGEEFRSSDDGEPSGSAGRPILQQLEGHGLTQLVVVVSRWFGGTKLGVGGLMRAYGGAAGRALDRAPLRTVVITAKVAVSHPYECSSAVQALLAARSLEPREASYEADVRLVLELPEREVEGFRAELADGTAGRGSLEVLGE